MPEVAQVWSRWAPLGAAGIAVAGLAGAAGYLAGQRAAVPTDTRLTLATCGLAPAPAAIHLPLAVLLGAEAGMVLGPIRHPGLDAPLSLHFRPLGAGEAPRPVLSGGVLELPVDPGRLPDAVHLSCRYGAIARVEFRRGPLRQSLEVVTADTDPEAEVPQG